MLYDSTSFFLPDKAGQLIYTREDEDQARIYEGPDKAAVDAGTQAVCPKGSQPICFSAQE